MTLPSSGSISLSAIQTEFGGVNPASLSEYYAGGGRVPAGCAGVGGPIPSSGALDFSDFYGATQSQTLSLTVGTNGSGGTLMRGYNTSPAIGSLTPNTLACKGNAVIAGLYFYAAASNSLVLDVVGTLTNAGWTNITVNGTLFTRASASFSVGSLTSWQWISSGNPFGAPGAVNAVVIV